MSEIMNKVSFLEFDYAEFNEADERWYEIRNDEYEYHFFKKDICGVYKTSTFELIIQLRGNRVVYLGADPDNGRRMAELMH